MTGESFVGNFAFDANLGSQRNPSIFSYLVPSEIWNFQATCLHVRQWAEIEYPSQLPVMVECDLEQSSFYRLWGPYHGY